MYSFASAGSFSPLKSVFTKRRASTTDVFPDPFCPYRPKTSAFSENSSFPLYAGISTMPFFTFLKLFSTILLIRTMLCFIETPPFLFHYIISYVFVNRKAYSIHFYCICVLHFLHFALQISCAFNLMSIRSKVKRWPLFGATFLKALIVSFFGFFPVPAAAHCLFVAAQPA